VEDNPPPLLLINHLAIPRCHIIADDADLGRLLCTKPPGEQCSNDGLHAAREDDNGHVGRLGPLVKLLEVRIEGDVLPQQVDDRAEGRRDGVHHLLKGVAEGAPAVQDVLVALLAQGDAEAEVVRAEVIGVLFCPFLCENSYCK